MPMLPVPELNKPILPVLEFRRRTLLAVAGEAEAVSAARVAEADVSVGPVLPKPTLLLPTSSKAEVAAAGI